MEVVAPHAAEVWGVDKSVAVDVAQANVGHLDNCRVVQADLFELPFNDRFDFIYSIGVIHHTPDPAAALAKLATHLRPGGELCVWVYSLGVSSGIKARWVPRPYQFYVPFVRHLPDATRPALFALYAKMALAAGELPVLGKVAPVFLPIQDLRKKGPLQDGWEPDDTRDEDARERIRFDWAMHSVYDQFTPTHARLQSNAEVLEWGRQAGLVDVRNGPVPATVIGRRPS
jgi:SAM-dependent methyltransferase